MTWKTAKLAFDSAQSLARPRLFRSDAGGSTVVVFALALPVLLGAAGVAVDFAMYSSKQQALQSVADATSLASAKQLSLAGSSDASVQAAADAYLADGLQGDNKGATGVVTVDRNKGTVKIEITEYWTPFFAQFLNANITPVKVSSTATLAGENKLCMLALEPNSAKGIEMDQNAHLEAKGCSVYSNSKNSNGIWINSAATMTAAMICSVGGVNLKSGSAGGDVLTDCPILPDPLATFPIPGFGGCDYTNTKYTSGNITLNPGVYCGGLEVSKTAVVNFNPGTYVMKDGKFKVSDTASVTGKNTAFLLSGIKSSISFLNDATINLSGAESGSMAGLLFYNDVLAGNRTHLISATNATTLTGTIYLPGSTLQVDPNSNVGAKSAYTAIIANKISILMGPNLVLNTDYGATNVPVPTGLVSSASVVLSN